MPLAMSVLCSITSCRSRSVCSVASHNATRDECAQTRSSVLSGSLGMQCCVWSETVEQLETEKHADNSFDWETVLSRTHKISSQSWLSKFCDTRDSIHSGLQRSFVGKGYHCHPGWQRGSPQKHFWSDLVTCLALLCLRRLFFKVDTCVDAFV